jgi:hypothetical protein
MIRKVVWCVALLLACVTALTGAVTLWNSARDYRRVEERCGVGDERKTEVTPSEPVRSVRPW